MAFVCPFNMDSPSQMWRDLTGQEEEKNPVKKFYNRLFRADIARWVCACAVIGLSAGVLSEHPGPKMLVAAIYNLAIASLHFFFLKVPVSPQGPLNPSPPKWYLAFLAISIAMWICAFILMFIIRVSADPEEVYRLSKRSVRDGFSNADTGPLGQLESMTIACGCCGIAATICSFYQCYAVHQILTTRFTKSQMRDAYQKEAKTRSSNDDNTFPSA